MSHKREICNPQMGNILSHNREMEKNTKLREILAANVTRLMSSNPDLSTLEAVAARAIVGDKKLAKSTVDRAKKNEVPATLDTVEGLARAFDVSPIDLLTDEETRNEESHLAAMKGDEGYLIALFEQLPPNDRKRLITRAKDMVSAARYHETPQDQVAEEQQPRRAGE